MDVFVTEDVCFVRPAGQVGPVEPKDFILPNGQTISVGEERVTVPEALFKPSTIGKCINLVILHKSVCHTNITLGQVHQ